MDAADPIAVPSSLPTRLVALRGELTELAFELDQRGSGDAAPVAMMIAARLAELYPESSDGDLAPSIHSNQPATT